jgi:hypothetical protein
MRVHKKDLFQFVGEKTLIFHSMDRNASNKLCLSKMYTHTRGNEGGFVPPRLLACQFVWPNHNHQEKYMSFAKHPLVCQHATSKEEMEEYGLAESVKY